MSRAFDLRLAVAEDAAELARFAANTFAETFAADNTAADMAAYLEQSFSEEIQRREITTPGITTMLAELEGELAGYSMIRLGGEDSGQLAGAHPVELQRLYVGSAWKGVGVAQALMQAAETSARQQGGRTLWLGVWERNHRAIAFYRKCGFIDIGTHEFRLGDDVQSDRLMSKPLAS
ncbi:MAG: GNAT family N-acetyltransferase [Acidobacteriota bacterium]